MRLTSICWPPTPCLFKTASICKVTQRWRPGWLVTNHLEGVHKKTDVAYVRYYHAVGHRDWGKPWKSRPAYLTRSYLGKVFCCPTCWSALLSRRMAVAVATVCFVFTSRLTFHCSVLASAPSSRRPLFTLALQQKTLRLLLRIQQQWSAWTI